MSRQFDLEKAKRAQMLCTKLQNLFRKELAFMSVEGKLEQQKQKLNRRATCDFPEGEALQDFVSQLKAKKITPEAFFRLCDANYTRNVPKEVFVQTMQNMGIRLSATQTKRLVMLFDENLSNTISLEEYQNALEAFSVSQEQHVLSNNAQKAHKPFELQALEKYFAVLEQRRMTPEELFASVCVDPEGYLDLNQMRDFILNIKPSMTVKELQAIKNFYDVDKDGKITRKEFIQADARARKSVTIRKQQEDAGEFESSNIEAADQSAPPVTSARNDRAATIIQSMDNYGIPFYMFVKCAAQSTTKTTIDMAMFSRVVSIYPKLRETDRDYLISLIQTSNRMSVKVNELKNLAQKYANPQAKLKVDAHMAYIANGIVNHVRTQYNKPESDAATAVKFGINKELERISVKGPVMSKAKAIEFFKKIALGSPADIEALMKSFQSYDGSKLEVNDLRQVLQYAAVTQLPSKKPMLGDGPIPNYAAMEPRAKTDAAIKYVVSTLQKQSLDPIQAFRMGGQETVKSQDLIRQFIKLDPSLDNALVSQAVSTFGSGLNKPINQAMFEAGFGLKSSTLKQTRPQTAKITSENELPALIRKLDNVMMREGVAPLQAFKKADYNRDGNVDINELKKAFSSFIPNETIPSAELNRAMAAFDVNNDQRIDEQEFINVFTDARKNLPVGGGDGSDFEADEIEGGDQSAPTMMFHQAPTAPKKKVLIGSSGKAPQAVDESKLPKDAEKLISLIEKNYLNEPIESYFDDLLENDQVTVKVVHFRMDKNKGTGGIPLNLVEFLCSQVMGAKTKNVKMGNLVRYIQAGKSCAFNLVAFSKTLTLRLGQPLKDKLAEILEGEEDGLTVEELFESFKTMQGVRRWDLACFFYAVLGENDKGSVIQLDAMVNVLLNPKNVNAQQKDSFKVDMVEESADQGMAPVRSKREPTPAPVQQKQRISPPSEMEMENDLNAAARKKLADECIKQLIVQNPDEKLAKEIDGYWGDSTDVSEKLILGIYKGYIMGIKGIMKRELVVNVINKLDAWADNLPGDNYEAREKVFADGFAKIQLQNNKIKELDLLAFRQVIKSVNHEIKLDTWELLVAYILFVSHDDLNDLLLDQTFLLTSNQDFEEDDVEEKERFINRCWGRVRGAYHIIKCIVGENEIETKAGRPPLKVMDSKVFCQIRFSRIAHQIRTELTHPQAKASFLKHFQDAHCNQLTYFDFFNLLEKHNVKVGEKECNCVQGEEQRCAKCNEKEWQREAFVSYLDDYGEAHISIDNFMDFLDAFNINIGPRLSNKRSFEALARAKADVSWEQYVLDEKKDYFRGCPTILNSEVAAIVKAEQLYNECRKNKKEFLDKDFGPQFEGDKKGSEDAIYFPGERTRAMPRHEDMKWMRPSQFLSGGEEGAFLKDDAGSNDVCQGQIGDCWFIGAMSVLATRDELLYGGAATAGKLVRPGMMVDKHMAQAFTQGVYPPIFHKFRSENIYVLRFFKEFAWRYVIIDDQFPVFAGNDELIFARCANKAELWVPLIEKAYAKLFGCYQTLISGFIDDGLHDMTSFVNEKLKLHDAKGFFDESTAEDFWLKLKQAREGRSLMGCSSNGATEREVVIDGERTGIMSGHAYGLNDVFEITDKETKEEFRLLRVRNPWGRTEWNGPWSDNSDEIKDHEKMIMEYVNELPPDEQFKLQDDDGTFLIDFVNFRDVYNRLFVAIDFPDVWNGIRFFSEWTPETTGGLPVEGTEAAMIRFAENPQFLFAPTRDCELFVSMAQPDGRVKGTDGSYDTFPFKTRLNTAMLMLVQLPKGQEKMLKYVKDQVIRTEKPTVLHELSMRHNMKAGERYVLIPAPKSKNDRGKFFLSMYFDLPMYEVDIKRLNGPNQCYEFIPEEYEKMSKRVPNWKVNYVQKSIPYILGQHAEDTPVSKSLKKSAILGGSMKKRKTVKRVQ